MTALWVSFALIFLAEMGDKTQLVALTLATRYRPAIVILGITVATTVVHLLSVFIGDVVGNWIPLFYIKVAAGLSFLGFAVWTLRGDELDDDEVKEHRWGPFMTTAIIFFLAELGDKTQLATITLATSYDIWWTWIGSTLGMVVADGLAIAVGIVLGKRIPEKAIKYGAVTIFILFGILTIVEAFYPLNFAG
ncbi:TMEM165/GDT1 family protein [Heliophilum fasciatum]|uniref:GDT1 family protein n=1 Tax=Heliophilum fasciatum TaxID=35700 RepID=A0A4R2RM06_9FIRM|nr:TMEM165/GDT1 family protein [Heliophilum fasciatum]MCW2277632.1 putative Ca2+/H+ antiporter (TMEM165/GDT1 family) [Heliophilum fasciatum]TCP64980.1 putative Ca2+/H+ antiporter (TMEM165/GDT1 family) [Heliophilum fasciatum]